MLVQSCAIRSSPGKGISLSEDASHGHRIQAQSYFPVPVVATFGCSRQRMASVLPVGQKACLHEASNGRFLASWRLWQPSSHSVSLVRRYSQRFPRPCASFESNLRQQTASPRATETVGGSPPQQSRETRERVREREIERSKRQTKQTTAPCSLP